MVKFEKVKRIKEDIKLPERSTLNSAGYDFFAIEELVIKPRQIIKIPTGYKAKFSSDEALLVLMRSSLGFKYNLRLTNQVGLIDSDYYDNESNEGHIWVSIQNEGDQEITINKNMAYSQGVFIKFLITDNDEATVIRTGGYGSTDRRN